MNKKTTLILLTLLIMFPQFVETIYSPALPQIASEFRVNHQEASRTISLYFMAFAIGVVFWGIASDVIGRRKAMIYGLAIYGLGTILALLCTDFTILLIARLIAAFGAAVGSVVTQTILRDLYDKKELTRVFSIMGIALSVSPVVGLLTGGILVGNYGYAGVFLMLLFLAVLLTILTLKFLPETKKETCIKPDFIGVFKELLCDKSIWLSVFLVGFFNIMFFSYYSLAPFIFEQLGLSSLQFGYSGIVLAFSSLIGALVNKKLIYRQVQSYDIILIAAFLTGIGAGSVLLLKDSLWFLIGVMFIVIAFGMAIPNILSLALLKYKNVTGTAGSFFGLMYYTLIGIGLVISGWLQDLGLVLSIGALLLILLALAYKRGNR
ncbi:multidrug effflux MFS transporter [Flavobacterium sp. F-65]|uniref:Multidrug effflux MFS transporter n=1 Tax=Flavobacterium pisciphilum TaxID=2893755 RepID=A0ABS8MY37_9FLAO|nr:multidrug effflux MFS transporter [Flavobacterium sp. F-65]MCC9073703.1 multidrug effflux MFS transporter [Flavobacterium sp. F-65]